jgi:hypothetical protein
MSGGTVRTARNDEVSFDDERKDLSIPQVVQGVVAFGVDTFGNHFTSRSWVADAAVVQLKLQRNSSWEKRDSNFYKANAGEAKVTVVTLLNTNCTLEDFHPAN